MLGVIKTEGPYMCIALMYDKLGRIAVAAAVNDTQWSLILRDTLYTNIVATVYTWLLESISKLAVNDTQWSLILRDTLHTNIVAAAVNDTQWSLILRDTLYTNTVAAVYTWLMASISHLVGYQMINDTQWSLILRDTLYTNITVNDTQWSLILRDTLYTNIVATVYTWLLESISYLDKLKCHVQAGADVTDVFHCAVRAWCGRGYVAVLRSTFAHDPLGTQSLRATPLDAQRARAVTIESTGYPNKERNRGLDHGPCHGSPGNHGPQLFVVNK
ncbi:hypothetical protein J6590_045151 [Homalodisca vitripennis]|nr:hypothetical protein J6590_045151 [Homalodisca vitripennis]